MTPDLYIHLAARARGHCECGCRSFVPPGEVDHFFGRGKADELESTCWILTPACHRAKTDNRPDAATWLRRYVAHCRRWGYAESAEKASARLLFVETRKELMP